MLEAQNLCVSYSQREIIKSVSLTVKPGEVVGLVAPNGEGKTTLLKALVGTIAHKGSVTIDGFQHKHKVAFYRNIYFADSEASLYPGLSAKDHLDFVKGVWKSSGNVEKIAQLLRISPLYQ